MKLTHTLVFTLALIAAVSSAAVTSPVLMKGTDFSFTTTAMTGAVAPTNSWRACSFYIDAAKTTLGDGISPRNCSSDNSKSCASGTSFALALASVTFPAATHHYISYYAQGEGEQVTNTVYDFGVMYLANAGTSLSFCGQALYPAPTAYTSVTYPCTTNQNEITRIVDKIANPTLYTTEITSLVGTAAITKAFSIYWLNDDIAQTSGANFANIEFFECFKPTLSVDSSKVYQPVATTVQPQVARGFSAFNISTTVCTTQLGTDKCETTTATSATVTTNLSPCWKSVSSTMSCDGTNGATSSIPQTPPEECFASASTCLPTNLVKAVEACYLNTDCSTSDCYSKAIVTKASYDYESHIIEVIFSRAVSFASANLADIAQNDFGPGATFTHSGVLMEITLKPKTTFTKGEAIKFKDQMIIVPSISYTASGSLALPEITTKAVVIPTKKLEITITSANTTNNDTLITATPPSNLLTTSSLQWTLVSPVNQNVSDILATITSYSFNITIPDDGQDYKFAISITDNFGNTGTQSIVFFGKNHNNGGNSDTGSSGGGGLSIIIIIIIAAGGGVALVAIIVVTVICIKKRGEKGDTYKSDTNSVQMPTMSVKDAPAESQFNSEASNYTF